MTHRTAQILLVLAAFIAGGVLFSTLIFIVTGKPPAVITQVATPSAVGGPFQLVDQNAKAITDKDIKGYPTLVFFGFTNCPDVCPTTLFEVSEIMRSLGKDADRVKALFVSVDPERDTPEKIKDYLQSFDPHLVGVTGSPESIAAMGKAYRVYFKKVPLDGGGYTMDHTAIVYLMDKDGRFVAPFNMKRKPAEAADDLRRYL